MNFEKISNDLLYGSGLMNYQEKIKDFFLNSNRDILLLYMLVGTGKSISSLACGIQGLESGKFKNIVILSPKSVQAEFKANLDLYYSFKKYN